MVFEEQLNEAMSAASYMDVSELRTLYYGRLGIYVAFSDNADIPKDGFSENQLVRPWSIVAHTVDTVVGRKASSNLYYGHVFRFKDRSGEFLEDIKSYSLEDYNEDLEILKTIPYIDPEELETAAAAVSSNPRHRLSFSRLWSLTQRLASSKGRLGDKWWRRVLLDLGYIGFNDPQGTGIIGKRNQQTTIMLTFGVEEFDIVPIQKYRKDKRQRIIDDINKKNKFNQTRRNRVAKKKTAAHRGTKNKSVAFIKDMIKLSTLGVM